MTPAHFPLDRLAKALRADGINCVIRTGAQGKSARRFASVGYYVGCQAIVQHHTVSSGLFPANDLAWIDGGQGDGWIVSNAYTALDGTVHLIASGPTYTEGTGGPFGIIPENRGNDVAFSNEIASWGAVDSAYPNPPQQDAVSGFAYHAAVIAADVWEWPDDPFATHRCFAHHEWTTRKVDPRGVSRWSPNGGEWDMDLFRSELRNRHTTPPPEDDDMPRSEFILKPPPGSPSTWPFLYACGGSVRPAVGEDVEHANANGVPVIDRTEDHVVRYRNLHIAAMSGREPGQ